MTHPKRWLAVPLALTLAVAAGCGGEEETTGGKSGETGKKVSGRVQVMAVWTGGEQKAFEAVLDGFKQKNPDVTVRFNSSGDQLATTLATAVEGGNPPDLAVIPQPGVVKDFEEKGALKPIEFARDTIEQHYGPDWVKLGTIGGKLYGLFFKGANKSTVWFNPRAFEDAGVEPPQDFNGLLESAETIKASGVPPFSIAGADGWTLTDLFENIYLRTAGPEKYDQLAEHKIPWTDASVKQALNEMKKVLAPANVAGGPRRAQQIDFPKSVSQVFEDPPKAAMVIEGDFVQGVIADQTKAKPSEGFDVFPFPAIEQGGDTAVVGGGDEVVMLKDTPAARALIEYLATPEAAEIWAKRGGFASPNKDVDAAVYPDELTRKTATALAEADPFRYDMSDLAPAAFGGTPGEGEWKILQDFLRNQDVDKAARDLERAAKRTFK